MLLLLLSSVLCNFFLNLLCCCRRHFFHRLFKSYAQENLEIVGMLTISQDVENVEAFNQVVGLLCERSKFFFLSLFIFFQSFINELKTSYSFFNVY